MVGGWSARHVGRQRSASALAILGAALLVAIPSQALASVPLSLTSAYPPDGTVVSPANPLPIELTSPVAHLHGLHVLVSAVDVQKPDGELLSSLTIAGLDSEEPAPGVYRSWDQVPFVDDGILSPGKYYWQAAIDARPAYPGTPASPLQLSPVFWFVVVGGEPQLTRAHALGAIKSSIREHTGRRAHHLNALHRGGYFSTDEGEWFARWTSTAHLSPSTVIYEGNFRVRLHDGTITVQFLRGRRHRRSCTHPYLRPCAVEVSW